MIGCAGLEEAKAALETGPFHLVTTALILADGDGLTVAKAVRTASGQAYVPVIVVSGEAQARLEDRSLSEDVTDYFDKAPRPHRARRVHSRLRAARTGRRRARAVRRGQPRRRDGHQAHARTPGPERRAHDQRGRRVEVPRSHREGEDAPGADLVLTDVYLKGELSGRDLLARIRNDFGYSKRQLPVLVMTGDENRDNQSGLLREGANDLVLKPIEERLLVTKTLFQLRVAKLPEQRSIDA